MKTWTTQAEKRLQEYLAGRARREGFDGEEAEELKSDLRRHIHEEAEKEAAGGIGLMQLETILGRLDAGYRPLSLPPPGSVTTKPKPMKTSLSWACGVVMPLVVVIFEWLTSFCGGVFFDPIATLWHQLLVLSVPAANAWLLRGAPGGSEVVKGWVAGFAGVIAVFYALLFLPLVPASLIAVIFVGIGLLSLTPVLTGIWTFRIGRLRRRESADPVRFRLGWWRGFAVAALALVFLEGPAVWTRANLSAALEEGSEPDEAIGRLRAFHSERTLLRACYEGNRGTTMATDVSGWLARGWRVPLSMAGFGGGFGDHDSERVRDLFFRVTGRPFNTLKPPRMLRDSGMARGRAAELREVEFDNHLGGDQVAVRLRHLDLAESRFDGHVDGRSGIGYGEWTMVFHNGAAEAREARCQVLLPRGGRVSRLTLWVNGEPREAAFSSVAKVKAAYKEIAVVQRKDPVLVTMSGPDTVMVQCFPVPARGEMKIRFGVTAPLDRSRWELPRILERNFGTKEGLEHAVWLQADRDFALRGRGEKDRRAAEDGEGRSLAVTLPPVAAMGDPLAIEVAAGAAPEASVWCEDKFAQPYERYLVRETAEVRRDPAGKVLVVIDGSASMDGAKDWLVAALKNDVTAGRFGLLLADDGAKDIDLAGLEKHRFSGGRDNEPALREAVRRAKAGEAGGIVWIHGPQAVGLSQAEALLQMIERGNRRPVIHEVMAANGPNRLAESLHRSGVLVRGSALIEPRADFAALMNALVSGREEVRWHWRRAANPPEGPSAPVWDHLARHWAIEAVDSPFSEVPEDERPALAARYQLVTRVSGAVVLETMEQFERHGLTPVDATAAPSIPGVPEPSTALMLLLAGSAAVMRRRREGRRR